MLRLPSEVVPGYKAEIPQCLLDDAIAWLGKQFKL
jgi:hypothetical protein